MLTFESRGSFDKTTKFLRSLTKREIYSTVESYAQKGVAALSAATPKESGETAAAWDCEVKVSGRSCTITWTNSHVVGGKPLAIMLQYGHGTGTGGYVSGRDYINPALRPVFDEIADKVWKAVTSA